MMLSQPPAIHSTIRYVRDDFEGLRAKYPLTHAPIPISPHQGPYWYYAATTPERHVVVSLQFEQTR